MCAIFYRSTERKGTSLQSNHYSVSLQVISSNKATFSWLSKNTQHLFSFLHLVRSFYINSQKTDQTCLTTVLSEFTSVNKWWLEHNSHPGCACVRSRSENSSITVQQVVLFLSVIKRDESQIKSDVNLLSHKHFILLLQFFSFVETAVVCMYMYGFEFCTFYSV